VTSLFQNAFINCTSLTSAYIGSGVPTIPEAAFSGCTSLQEVTINANAENFVIQENAFNGCEELTSITLPDSTVAIGVSAFSGCIGLTLAKLVEGLDVTLFDISATAINATKRNAELHHLQERVHIVQGDVLLEGTNYFPDNMFDMIISNPPYIKSADMPTLAPEVQAEPALALDGGVDGLTFYRAIASFWQTPLKSGGHLVLEAGFDTTKDVASLLTEYPFTDIQTHKDLGQNDRMITAVKE